MTENRPAPLSCQLPLPPKRQPASSSDQEDAGCLCFSIRRSGRNFLCHSAKEALLILRILRTAASAAARRMAAAFVSGAASAGRTADTFGTVLFLFHDICHSASHQNQQNASND